MRLDSYMSIKTIKHATYMETLPLTISHCHATSAETPYLNDLDFDKNQIIQDPKRNMKLYCHFLVNAHASFVERRSLMIDLYQE